MVGLENPWYAGGWAILAVAVLLACSPLIAAGAGTWRRVAGAPAAFVTTLAAATLYFRLPSITSGVFLNADEAQMTAQAITFLHHPVPWLDFDGTTSGPLNTMIVALPALFGARPTLASSRLIGALLLVVMLVCLYVASRRLCGDLAARVSVLLPLAVVCAATDGAYVQYASELLPIALCAVAVMCIAELVARRAAVPAFAGTAGVAIGAMPLAKLQAAPLALVLGIACAVVLYTVGTAGDRRRSWLSFAGGVVAVPALILIAVAARGAFDDFLTAYVVFPRVYLAGNCCHVAGLDFFLADAPFAAFFLIAACLAAALAAATAFVWREAPRSGSRKTYALLGFCALMVVVALYTVEAPQTPFVHYLLFLVLPVSGIVATLLGAYAAALRDSPRPRWILAASVLVMAIACVVPVARGSLAYNPFLDHDILTVQPPGDAAVRTLEASIEPGQRVAMWGWMPQYLVYTGAVMGTRDSISQFQIEPRSFRDYYRARYLSDFLRNQPDFVIEAIGPNAFAFHDRATQGVASFPELNRLLDASYRVVFDSVDVRLFERKRSFGRQTRVGVSVMPAS